MLVGLISVIVSFCWAQAPEVVNLTRVARGQICYSFSSKSSSKKYDFCTRAQDSELTATASIALSDVSTSTNPIGSIYRGQNDLDLREDGKVIKFRINAEKFEQVIGTTYAFAATVQWEDGSSSPPILGGVSLLGETDASDLPVLRTVFSRSVPLSYGAEYIASMEVSSAP